MQQTAFDRWLLKKYVYITEIFCSTLPEELPPVISVEKSDGTGTYLYRLSSRDHAAAEALITSMRMENIMFASRVANLDTAFARIISNPRRSPTWTVIGTAVGLALGILFLTGLPQRAFEKLIAHSDKAAEERYDRERHPGKYKNKPEAPSLLDKAVAMQVNLEKGLAGMVESFKGEGKKDAAKADPPPAPPRPAPVTPPAALAKGVNMITKSDMEKMLFAQKKEKEPRLTLYIFFDYDSVEFSQDGHSEHQFQEMGQLLASYPWNLFAWRIEGYSDRKGEVEYNRLLSQRRADMILARLEKEYLVERRKVTALGKGEVETGPDDVENPLLRRIVLIRGDMVDRPGAKVTATESAANPPQKPTTP